MPAGLSYWHTDSFGLYGVNPPLWKLISTLPVLAFSPVMAGLEPSSYPGIRPEWDVAREFARLNHYNYYTLTKMSRLSGVGWLVLGGAYVYRLAFSLYGPGAGLMALILWCYGPNILGNAAIVTPDVPCAAIGLLATYGFWRYLRTGTVGHAMVAGMLLGVAQLTKFTSLILYAVWPVLAVAHRFDRGSTISPRITPIRTTFGHGLLITAVAVMVMNAGYGFAGSFARLGDYDFVSRAFAGSDGGVPGNRFRGSWLESVPVPLPYDYLIGVDVQRRDLEGGMPPSYLAGVWRSRGWWYYYLYGLAVKVPLGTLALTLWSLGLTVRRSRLSAGWANELTLWLPALAVLTAASSQTGFSHHFRYILPMAPFVFVATGKLAGYICWKTWKRGALVIALLGWSVFSSLSVYPHSLSYFNELAGGPDRGYEHLVDSNIDWGQDLFFFQKWARQHPEAKPLGLAYFNYIDYRIVLKEKYGDVPPDPPTGTKLTDLKEAAPYGPHPGWFAVDIHNLMDPSGRCHYLMQRFKPVAKAGYSIDPLRIRS